MSFDSQSYGSDSKLKDEEVACEFCDSSIFARDKECICCHEVGTFEVMNENVSTEYSIYYSRMLRVHWLTNISTIV